MAEPVYTALPIILWEMSQSDLNILCGDPTGTNLDTDRFDNAKNQAEALIDTYLEGRYPVPWDSWGSPVVGCTCPEIITKLASDLLVWFLNTWYYKNDKPPSAIYNRYIMAISTLKKLSSGEITITDYIAGKNAPPPVFSSCENKNRLFTEDILNNFQGDI